ncbi:MAG: bifunctional precorrin-2 dehydrogenase/sirohydrochlorin ferrochelatase [Methanomicrobiales archaeon]
MLPLILDLTGRKVVIFGGGPVGARKAGFFRGECRVVVASRSFSREIQEMDVERIGMDLEHASDGDLGDLMAGAVLVVAAVKDPVLNERIRGIAMASGIFCNSATGRPGDVIIPSVGKGRSHLVAVTTFGRSPAMARFVREKIGRDAEETDLMIELQERAREVLKREEPSQERRSATLWEILRDPEAWKALSRGPDKAWEYVGQRYLHG